MRVSGFGIRVLGFGIRGLGFEFRVSGFEFRVWGYGTSAPPPACGVSRDWGSRDGGKRCNDLAVGLVPREHPHSSSSLLLSSLELSDTKVYEP